MGSMQTGTATSNVSPTENPIEARRRDADDLKRISIQTQPLAYDGRIAAKVALPEGVANVRPTDGAPRLVIRRTQEAAQVRRHSKYSKKLAADTQSFGVSNFASRRKIELLRAPDGNL
jgi:YbbR domain-containing protein